MSRSTKIEGKTGNKNSDNMSAMDTDNDVSTILATLRLEIESSDLINTIYLLEDFYERKLWHQLTMALDQFYFDSPDVTSELKLKIYNLFINQFSSNINPIKIVDFLLESFSKDNKQTLEELLALKEKFVVQLKKNLNVRMDEEQLQELIESDESIVYVNLQISRYYLLLNDLNAAEEILDKLNDKFGANGTEFDNPKIIAAYYLCKCELYKLNKNYNAYYSNGLLYLSSVDVEKLSQQTKIKLCYELCISALLGDKIYNFGELILHDILNTITTNSEYVWLYNLIQNLNAGNLKEFNKWLQEAFVKSPFLTQSEVFLKQKIIIMSLLELVSLKSTTNKQLKFKEISEFTGTPVNDVEHLIIKCFSLNLIKGYINQINEVLTVTWLQPRILNLDQVNTLLSHLRKWDNGVEELAREVHKNGGAVWAGV